MKEVGGVWLPDHEQHLVEWIQNRNEVVDGKLTYQYHKLQAALKHVKQFRTAIDVGAHCGLWSMHLAKKFLWLDSFEPVEDHRHCFRANLGFPMGGHIRTHGHVTLHPFALGASGGRVSMKTADASSGDTTVADGDDVEMRTLDSFQFADVDFIKLDCEGYELFALQGGEQTILKHKPCIIVEQKPGKAQQFGLPETGAVDYLQDLGAVLRQVISGDYILSWD